MWLRLWERMIWDALRWYSSRRSQVVEALLRCPHDGCRFRELTGDPSRRRQVVDLPVEMYDYTAKDYKIKTCKLCRMFVSLFWQECPLY